MALEPGALAAAIQSAFPQAWRDETGSDLPPSSPDAAKQQLALFLAIARGLLKHLSDNQATVITAIDLKVHGSVGSPQTFDATNVHLDVTGG
jgi:hypothetical protein